MRSKDDNFAPFAALLAAQVFFGSLPVIAKVVLRAVPAIALVSFRVGVTALVLIAVQIIRGMRSSPTENHPVSDNEQTTRSLPFPVLTRRGAFGSLWLRERGDYWRLAVLSLFGVTFNQLLFITGLSLTKASNTSLLAVTIPIFALTAGAVIGAERLRFIKVVGIVLAAVGVLLIIDPRNASFSSQTTLGDLLIVLNSLSYGIYVAISKRVITRNGVFRSMMWVFVFASVICVPMGAWSFSGVDLASVGTGIWLIMIYISIGATAAPYLLNAYALARVNASTVAVFVYLQPLIGFTLAAAFLSEQIGVLFAIAALLIFTGVYMVSKRHVPVET